MCGYYLFLFFLLPEKAIRRLVHKIQRKKQRIALGLSGDEDEDLDDEYLKLKVVGMYYIYFIYLFYNTFFFICLFSG
jgi:hypothetical protein